MAKTPRYFLPSGTIIAYGGAFAPPGWLLCDGSTVSRSTYSELYTAIGNAWGYGDNATTFHLPDLRGRFLRGRDSGVARDPERASRTASNSGGNTGDAVGSVETDAVQGHHHNVQTQYQGGSFYDMGNMGAQFGSSGGFYNVMVFGSVTKARTIETDGSNGTPRLSSESRPLNANVNYIIKY